MPESTRYTIEVTDADILKAKRNDSYICVVAQALARSIPDAHRIEVDTQAIRFSREGRRFIYLTPYAVQGYVVAFDAGETIEPFSFQLREPAKVKHQKKTAHGRRAVRRANTAQRQARRAAKSAGLDTTTPAVAEDIRAAYRAAYAAVTAEAPEEKTTETTGEGRVHTVPRVFKHRARTYGHRMLRINQQATS